MIIMLAIVTTPQPLRAQHLKARHATRLVRACFYITRAVAAAETCFACTLPNVCGALRQSGTSDQPLVRPQLRDTEMDGVAREWASTMQKHKGAIIVGARD